VSRSASRERKCVFASGPCKTRMTAMLAVVLLVVAAGTVDPSIISEIAGSCIRPGRQRGGAGAVVGVGFQWSEVTHCAGWPNAR
jgi:hypothetical protein